MMNKMLKKILLGAFVVAFAISFIPTDGVFAASKIKMSKCKIYLSSTSYIYDGKAKNPSITVKYGGKKVSKSKNYTVSYSNSKGPGTAKVTINGKGKYTGSVSKSYTISVDKVSNLKAEYNSNKDNNKPANIYISWTKPIKCSSYYIKVNKDGKSFGTYTTTKTNYTINDLGGKGIYEVSVYAVAGSKSIKSSANKISVLVGLEKQSISGSTGYTKTIGERNFNLNASAKTNLTYSSDNTKVASVDSKGNVSINATGTAIINVKAAETARYAPASKEVKITIKNLSTPSLSVKSPGYRRMDLTWNQVKGAQSYTIKETDYTNKTSAYTVDSPSEITTSFYDKTVGKAYKYTIQANTTVKDKTYTSSWATTVSATAAGTKVGEAAQGETKQLRGNQAGDQTNSEVRVRKWAYSSKTTSHKHNTLVVRFNDPAIAEKAASIVESVCANPHVGYDQGNRTSLATYAKKYGWDVTKITEDCDCDCMSLLEVGINGALKKELIKGLDARTGKANITKKLADNTLFTIYTDSKYLTTDAYLQRGDMIFTTTGNHGVMVL